MNRRWTESEKSVIRELFFEYDADEIAERLPGRTAKSIHHRAKELGLFKTPAQRGKIISLRWERDLESKLGEPICDWLSRRYVQEATYRELTKEVGINTRSLMRLMRKCNIEPISASAAAKRLIRDRPEILTNLRMSALTKESRFKLAKTRQAHWRTLQSDNEAAFMKALNIAGMFPIPELAVGRYNIDFAFPSEMLAVEHDPLWHKSKGRAPGDAMKQAFLESLGWAVLHIESRTSISFNVDKVLLALNRQALTHSPETST